MRETINRSVIEVTPDSQDAENSRGFEEGVACLSVGDRVRVRADAFLPKKLSYARCCLGVVTRVAKLITVQLDKTNNFETHCILVKPECLEHWSGQICVAESGRVSPTPDACTQNLTSSVLVTPTTIAKISCSSDIQEPSAFETCDCGHQPAKAYQQLSLLQHHRPASPSPFKENASVSRTSETVSPPSSERSPTQHLDSSVLKTSPDSSVVPSNQEQELGHISLLSSVKWRESGTMSNGFVSRAPTLPPPGVGNDCLWLGSHGALSHTSRAPGLSKSESISKAKGILGKGEVYNPDWLELKNGLPLGYSSPSESKTATQLREGDEKPSVMPSTPELQTSPSVESCTCPSCAQLLLRLKDGCGVCGWLPSKRKRSPNKKPATGSLARNVALKKGKEYSTWQYSYSVRDPGSKRGWRTVKEGVPKCKAPLVADAIREGRPIREILSLLGKEPRGELSE
jgi:hypothetical protein